MGHVGTTDFSLGYMVFQFFPTAANAEEMVQWVLDNQQEDRRIADRDTLYIHDLVYHLEPCSIRRISPTTATTILMTFLGVDNVSAGRHVKKRTDV
jgi:hypothetical protein